MKKPVILWIEDQPGTVADQIREAKKNYDVMIKVMPHDVKETLAEHQVAGIIVDVMLYGVKDLESIGIKHVTASQGMDAGWILLEHFIRADQSPYRNIPVLVLSARVFGEKETHYMQRLRTQGTDIQYLEKGQAGWQAEFSQWVEKLSKGN